MPAPLAAALLAAVLAPARAQTAEVLLAPPVALSSDTVREIARLEARLQAVPLGRRLLAESADVPRRERRLPGAPVAYVYGPPAYLAFDAERLPRLSEWEFELLLGRELALASFALPLDLPEGRSAARVREAALALELAGADKALSAKLRAAARIEAKALAATPEAPPARRGELERAAVDLALAARGPDEFLWAVERRLPESGEGFSLTRLEDFVKLNGPAFGGVEPGPEDHFVWIAGRRYPAELVRLARPLSRSGGLAAAREALDGVELRELPALSRRAKKWLGR